jgi:hypothetical protein
MRSASLLALGLSAVFLTGPIGAQEAPPRRLDFSVDSVARIEQEPRRTSLAVRNAFVRDQTILGILVYGPAFAAMVGDDGISSTAGYLVMAGGTFFAAAELTRRLEISEAQQLLATRMAWRTAGAAFWVVAAGDGNVDQGSAGAATLLGGTDRRQGTHAGRGGRDGVRP